MQNRDKLNAFFAEIEQQAFKTARYSTGCDEDALDMVQEAMLGFAKRYSTKPESDWRPLFFKVLYSRLTDFHRKTNFRAGIVRLFMREKGESDELDQMASGMPKPEQVLDISEMTGNIIKAIELLPVKQQQAVLLRAWQGFDTAETAEIMNVGTGSVKTHYSRGLAKLRAQLGET